MLGATVQNLVPQGFGHPCCRSYPSWAAKPVEGDKIRYTEFEVFFICFKICILIYPTFCLAQCPTFLLRLSGNKMAQNGGKPLKETVMRILVVSIIFC
jgi:hypothetical protein